MTWASFLRCARTCADQGCCHARNTLSHIFELVEVFRARVVDLAPESLMIEITGVESKIEGLIQVLNENEDRMLEISRTGRMVMRRGQHTSRVLEAMGTPRQWRRSPNLCQIYAGRRAICTVTDEECPLRLHTTFLTSKGKRE